MENESNLIEEKFEIDKSFYEQYHNINIDLRKRIFI